MPPLPDPWAPSTAPAPDGDAYTPVNCSKCNRAVSHDMALSTAPLSDLQRSACEWTDAPYVCDGCVTRALASGAISMADLMAAHGAPDDVLERCRALDANRGTV